MSSLHAVTFDCWGTLIYEPDAARHALERAESFLDLLQAGASNVERDTARQAFRGASERHWQNWRGGVATGAPEVGGWTLETLGIRDPDLEARLVRHLQERALDAEILVLDGARDTLQRLADRGIRRGLICDTGFSPARVVRRLLDRACLLELLEVTIFSDEMGVPKPDGRVFRKALDALLVKPEHTAHVGDLRRTDISGARDAGMQSVRIRWANDDDGDLPEADHVADSHPHLCEILGVHA